MIAAVIRFYWWPKLHHNIIKYINKSDICAKSLPNMANYSQKHLEISQVLIVVLAMDTTGCLPVTSRDTDGL